MEKEKRNLKVIFAKSGGNASKNSVTPRLTIPKKWVDDLGLNQENREVEVEYDGKKITIEPVNKK